MIKFLLFFCSFVVLFADQAQFFSDLQSALKLNSYELNCGSGITGSLSLDCSGGVLVLLSLNSLSLSAIPSSISFVTKLTTLSIINCGLSSLGSDFGSLTELQSLNLRNNISLRESTDLFAKMTQLTELNVSSTLISGSKLHAILDSSFCDSSCISSELCSKNSFCYCPIFDRSLCSMKECFWCSSTEKCLSDESFCQSCDSFSPTTCPSGCPSDSCRNCSLVVKFSGCVPPCSWCSSSEKCFSEEEKEEKCRICDSYNLTTCPSGCSGSCRNCSLIDKSSECVSPCSWCSSSDKCFSEEEKEEKCRLCDSYNLTTCPPGCSDSCRDCSLIDKSSECVSPCFWCSSSDKCFSEDYQCSPETPESSDPSESSSSLTLILICVLIPVFVLMVFVLSLVLFLRKNKRTEERSITMTMFNTSDMDTCEDTTSFYL